MRSSVGRNNDGNGAAYMSGQAINVTNKQSSFAKKNTSCKTSSLANNSTNSPMSAMQGSTMQSCGSGDSLSPRPASVED